MPQGKGAMFIKILPKLRQTINSGAKLSYFSALVITSLLGSCILTSPVEARENRQEPQVTHARKGLTWSNESLTLSLIHSSIESSIEEKAELQENAEARQLDLEDTQIHWESEQKRWEEIYEIYARDYRVSLKQAEIAREEGWTDDVKRREKEALETWAIAAEARTAARNAHQKAQEHLAEAQGNLAEAQRELRDQKKMWLAYRISYAKSTRDLEKCVAMTATLRPILMSHDCRIQEKRNNEEFWRSMAATQAEQSVQSGDIENAYKWKEVVIQHTDKIALLNAEQKKYRATLIFSSFFVCLGVLGVFVFLAIIFQQKERREGKLSSNKAVRLAQTIISRLLSEELYRDLLEEMDELFKEEEVTPLIRNIRIILKLTVLLIANAKILLDDMYNPDRSASVSSAHQNRLSDKKEKEDKDDNNKNI
jgi:hypothetical protein